MTMIQQEEMHPQHKLSLLKLIGYIMISVDEDGKWEDSRSFWAPMTTCFAVDLLFNAGFNVEDSWFIDDATLTPFPIKRSLQYLNRQIREDGQFGMDLWDAQKLGCLISRFRLEKYFPNYERLQRYIIKINEKGYVINKNDNWSGPAFYSTAVDYFDLIGLHDLSGRNTEIMLTSQQANGSWSGLRNKADESIISPVYDTSQVVLTLARKDSVKYDTEIQNALNYITASQEDEGCWRSNESYEVLYTSWGLYALAGKVKYKIFADKALDYLQSKMSDDGKCVDLLGTIMFATALRELLQSTINIQTFREYILISNKSGIVNELQRKIDLLQQDISNKDNKIRDYEKKYGDADIVLTKLNVFFLSILLTLVGFLGAIPVIIQFHKDEKPAADFNKADTTIQVKKSIDTTAVKRNPGITPGY